MSQNIQTNHMSSSQLTTDQENKPNGNKHKKRTNAPTDAPTPHSHHPTSTPTMTPTSKINKHSLHPTHSKTTINNEQLNIESAEELGGKTKPSRVGDGEIDPSPPPQTSEDVQSPEPTPVTVQKYLRGNVKDDVPEPSPVPTINQVKDDVPEPTIQPSVSQLKDDVPDASPVPSLSWKIGDEPIEYTIQPTFIPNNISYIIGDEPIPVPPLPFNSSMNFHTQSLIEQSTDYSSAHSTYKYGSSPYASFMFGTLMAFIVSVGIAFYYRKRFQYKRIPSGNKLDYPQSYEFA